ncbi:hypothetical protein [Micromonospora craniellae]|uniref:hypothetical protein n=1 Tax=Micromonospora craniellae TaxID=2294034 RepID=UPI0011C161D0|nr:hypothetical protein [Micromonospora craniellae]
MTYFEDHHRLGEVTPEPRHRPPGATARPRPVDTATRTAHRAAGGGGWLATLTRTPSPTTPPTTAHPPVTP